jgi:hypothetical protein
MFRWVLSVVVVVGAASVLLVAGAAPFLAKVLVIGAGVGVVLALAAGVSLGRRMSDLSFAQGPKVDRRSPYRSEVLV